MAKNKASYTLEIDADLKGLESKLATAKKALSGVLNSSEAPRGLDKTLVKVEDLLEKIRAKASQPIDTKGGFSSIEKDIDSAGVAISSLLRLIEQISTASESAKISFLPPEAQKEILAINSAIDKYSQSIEAAKTETKELVSARASLATIEEKLANAKSDHAFKESELKESKEEIDRAKGAIAAIEARKKALAEYRAEQEKIEKFYSTPNEDGSKKNRSKKYDEVSGRPQDIKKKIAALEEQSKGDEEALVKEKEALSKAKSNYDSYIKTTETAKRKVDELNFKHEEAAKKVKQLNDSFQEGSAESQQAAYTQLRLEAEKLGIELGDIGESFSEADANELIARFQALKQQGLDKIPPAADKAEKELKDFPKALAKQKEKVQEAAEAHSELQQVLSEQNAFEQRIKDFLGVAGATQVMRAAMRDAMQTITELDATMTEMAVVTDLSVGDYWDQLPEYSKNASALGVSINSAYKAATLYYQQGLKDKEVTAISTETLKMAKIANLEAADATDKMTAALRGFNMELNETSAQRVSDVYSQLAAITAADVDEISSAMSKTASIASSAGMEFETTAAFLSQIIETTRESAETAGTAMKTVIARFQELKKDPAEIGEVDGEIVDANKIETALRSVGVSLRDASGQFRNLDEVFLELSSKWDGLDTNTQRYIATIAAGSRQQSRFIAMMSNYARTQELVTEANNSAGASQKQFEKTMDSLEYKMENLRNAWHEFSMGIMNSDLVKTGVDILTKLLTIINKATGGLDGLGGSITKILGILTVFKIGKTIFEKMKQPLVGFFADIVREAGLAGEKAGNAAREGLNKSKETAQPQEQLPEGYKRDSNGRLHSADGRFVTKEAEQQLLANTQPQKKDLGVEIKKFAKDKTGISNIQIGIQKRQNEKNIKAQQDRIAEAKKVQASAPQGSQQATDAAQQIKDATKKLEEYKKAQDELNKDGATAWENIGKGVQQAGMAITGVGAGISMLGGLFSSLGLEELGEGFATAGNLVMIFGGALTALGPVISWIGTTFTIEGGKIAIAGTTAQLAWWWVLIIVVAVVALITLTAVAINAIQKSSPEAKLKEAEQAAEEAGKAAEEAADRFNTLKDSLNNLDANYDALENMRRGTEEWMAAVDELNSSVLDLISEYPELASLVKQEGGVLTLDVESDAVKNILGKYETEAVRAKGAELGAKIQANEAKQQVDFSNLDAINAVANKRGWETAGAWIGGGVAAGAGAGAASSLLAGPFAPLIAGPLAVLGSAAGLIVGGIGGAIAGPIEAAATKNDEVLQEATEALAEDVMKTGDMSTDHMKEVLMANGVLEAEAQIMAEEFAKDTEALADFASATVAAEAQQKAYYQAMATQAQSLIDLSKYSEDELNQMNSVVGGDRIKAYEASLMEDYKDDTKEEQNAALQEYAEEVYGQGAKVEDNKVVYYEDSEKKEAQITKEQLAQQMVAAQATEKAAKAMENVADALNSAAGAFGDNFAGHDIFKKLFSKDEGMAINASDLGELDIENLSEIYEKMGDAGKEVWETEEEFVKDYQDRVKKANLAFEDATKGMHKLGFSADKTASDFFGKMSAEAAKAWQNNLETLNMGGGDVSGLQTELQGLLSGLTEEQVNAVMGQINAIDMTDVDAWQDLKYVFDELNIPIANEALQTFIDKGIEVSNAIEKIDFDGLNESLNNTYALIEKIKESSSRSFGEEEYKKFVSNNKSLEKQFIRIGDEFVYMGGSINTLVEALEENTIANINEANRQLDSKIAFSAIAQGVEKNNVEAMDETQLREYLINVMGQAMSQGLDVADLGIAGFSNATDLYAEGVDKNMLLTWASAFAATGGQGDYYKSQKKEGMHQADVLKYAYENSASENARGSGSAYAEALQYQAIRSGGVSDAMLAAFDDAIEDLKQAEESGDAEAIKNAQDNVNRLSGSIAESTERIVEASEGRDAMQSLIDRATEALYNQSQKEIDKLQELKDATDEANSKLINKIQEQIEADRLARENEKAENNLTDLRSKTAYLGMDTSGANALQLMDLNEELKQAEQEYQDSLVDQAIQQLQDDNEKAAEQRERQISLAQENLDWQKENGVLARQAEAIVQESLAQINNGVSMYETSLYKTLIGGEETSLLGELANEDWVSELQSTMAQAAIWFGNQGVNKTDLGKDENGDHTVDEKDKKSAARNAAVTSAGNALQSGRIATGSSAKAEAERSGTALNSAMTSYISNRAEGQSEEEAKQEFFTKLSDNDLYYDYGNEGAIGATTAGFNDREDAWFDLTLYDEDGAQTDIYVETGSKAADQEGLTELWNATKQDVMDDAGFNTVVTGSGSDSKLFIRKNGGTWYEVLDQGANKVSNEENRPSGLINFAQAFRNRESKKMKAYKSGGLADFTGPAWLDGTKSKPEIVLNQRDSANFLILRDILSEVLNSGKVSENNSHSGDNHFDIEINVEKLESDYDVEQLADKIRRMLYDDATYRNVNAIGLLR